MRVLVDLNQCKLPYIKETLSNSDVSPNTTNPSETTFGSRLR